MKFYYPKDSNGNIIGFKTPESQVYDRRGVSLTDKLANLTTNGGTGSTGVTLVKTLATGETSLTFTDDVISPDSYYEFYTDKYGVSANEITDITDGSLTLKFDEQSEDIEVTAVIYTTGQHLTTGTVFTTVLVAGNTSVTITDEEITEDSIIDVYTDKGIDYTSLTINDGSIIIGFEEQEDDVAVKVEVR